MADDKPPIEAENELPEVDADLPLPEPVNNQAPVQQENPLEDKTEAKKDAKEEPVSDSTKWQRLRGWYVSHKKLSIPLSVLVLVLVIFALPMTRYPVAGLVLKKNLSVQVVDSTTKTPVSGASIFVGDISAQTNGEGKASLLVPVGKKTVIVKKNYYENQRANVLVPIFGKTEPILQLGATGRQVQISVKNSVSKNTLADVEIKVSDITAKTDKDGKALVVLPAGAPSQKATISLNGYNSAEVELKVSDSEIAQNDLVITPAGKLYFLSKLSGKIDVVKSDLDGTKRETVLAGTGKEDDRNTVLLASRDWKYLALLSRRDSDLAKLYLIETGNDKVTAIDEGNADFDLVGWSDSHFVYQVSRKDYQTWQSKQYALKSYEAPSKKINLLDETSASGSDNLSAANEWYGDTYLIGDKLVYSKSWNGRNEYVSTTVLTDKQAGIYSINVNGSGKQTHKTFGHEVAKATYLQSYLDKPDQIYFQVIEKSSDPKYFVYANNQVSEKSSIKDEFIKYTDSNQRNTYLQSPSGKETFWSEARDGKNTLFIGDGQGENSKQTATLSDYQTYGWFSDDYLLVSKNGSELYIFGSAGIKKDSEALKVTDYHKPAVSYPSYGGGYGGI